MCYSEAKIDSRLTGLMRPGQKIKNKYHFSELNHEPRQRFLSALLS